jgi:hypothetical protein
MLSMLGDHPCRCMVRKLFTTAGVERGYANVSGHALRHEEPR